MSYNMSILDLLFKNAALMDGIVVNSNDLGFGLTQFNIYARIDRVKAAPRFSASYNRFVDENLSLTVLTNKDSDLSIMKFTNEIALHFLK